MRKAKILDYYPSTARLTKKVSAFTVRWELNKEQHIRNLIMLGSILLLAAGRQATAVPKKHIDNVEQTQIIQQPLNVLGKPVQLAMPITERPPEPQQELATVEEPQPEPQVAVAQISGNAAMQYIFEHESSNNPYARNELGCLGLGQACPGSKLLAVCPNLGDVQCQISFFTNYANSTYGGWDGAYQFWLNHHWW